MVELVPLRASFVTCAADPAALDRLVGPASTMALRVAPDEALLVADDAAATLRYASDLVTAVDPDAVVIDTTDGWAVIALEGDRAAEVFARVSQVPLAPGIAQGEVAHVPAIVAAEPGRIVLVFPAMWRDAVRERILADGAGLGIVERGEPGRWAPASGARS
ncbi:MAG: hypothetical protein ACXVQU_08685 [Actinomycetota bacterium]